jgi:uncharacterized protein
VRTLLTQLIDLGLLADQLVVVWHSGEPLTLPVAYYQEAIETIQECLSEKQPNIKVMFDFQTNATLINESWCDFFEKYSAVINLGVSCDGPSLFHDAFRIDWKGRETFNRTLDGIEMLNQRGIKYNMIAVVSQITLNQPERFLEFFMNRRDNLTDFHFNVLASPCVGIDELQYGLEDRERYTAFYETMLALSKGVEDVDDALPVRNFDSMYSRIAEHGQLDSGDHLRLTSAPLRSLNMDHKGNITTFYAGLDISAEADRYSDKQGLSLGNLHTDTLEKMLRSEKFLQIINDFRRCHDRCADRCDYYAICPGGFELIQMANNKNGPETVECVIHVMALADAVLNHLDT